MTMLTLVSWKHLFLFIAVLNLSHIIHAQNTFSHRFVDGYQGMFINTVAATDTAYYAAGVYLNSGFHSFIYTFDLDGNIIHRKEVLYGSLPIDITSRDFIATERNSFIIGGRVYTDRLEGAISEYFPSIDSLRTQLYYYDTPEYAYGYGGSFDIFYEDNEILVAPTMETASAGPDSDIALFKFDLDFNQVSAQLFTHPRDNTGATITKNGDNVILASFLLEQGDFNYEQQIWVRELTPNNELIREYISPADELWFQPQDISKTNDDGYLITTASGYYRNFPQGPTDSVSVFLYYPYLLKLNADLEKEWTMELGFNWPSGGGRRCMFAITPTFDGHYAVVGEGDKTPVGPDTFRTHGIIAKITEDGEKLWERELTWMDTIMHTHLLSDIVTTPDGGFLIGGQANGFVNEDYTVAYQQAWLLKLDEYGCLVPGCQGPVSTEEELPDKQWVPLLFPNPVKDMLSVFLPPRTDSAPISMEIFNSAGQLMKREENLRTEVTYMLDIHSWPAGIYHLKCQSGTASNWVTQTFVKQ